jgi:CheY-like chemotaxis protein
MKRVKTRDETHQRGRGWGMASILLIEDDEGLAYALSASLKRGGHQIVSALDGISALKALETDEPIDLLLTDLVMPPGQPNGLSLALMARQKRRDLAVIFMTGNPHLRQYVEGDKLLMKPVNGDLLIAEIAASLARTKVIKPTL